LPLIVATSEDATRIVSRVEFDPTTNQLVGLVAPLNDNGLPIKHHFPAEKASAIVEYFKRFPKANNAIVIMVQSLSIGNSLKIDSHIDACSSS
jgi:hypothetical protein